MEVCPDFGYAGDNFCLDPDEDAPRNWKLLTDIINSKRKHEWLRNHIKLRTIRKEQEKEEQERRIKANMEMKAKKIEVLEKVETTYNTVLNPAIHKEMKALASSVQSSKEMF